MRDEGPTWEQLRARLRAPGYRTLRGEVRWADEFDGRRYEGWCRFVQAPQSWFVEDELGVQCVSRGQLTYVRDAEAGMVRYSAGPPSVAEPQGWSVLRRHLERSESDFDSPTDFFHPAGPAKPVEVVGRRAWEVTMLPPPHKEFPLVLTIDDLTGTLLREIAGGGAWTVEFLRFEPHVEVDHAFFEWAGQFQDARPDEDVPPRPEPLTPEDLERVRKRLTIIDGLAAALDRREDVFAAVTSARDTLNARLAIAGLLGVDEVTATAVLDTQLRRLTADQRQWIYDERDELRALLDEHR